MRSGTSWRVLLGALFVSLATLPAAPGQTDVSLGLAANYAVLGKKLNLSNVTIYGDVGVGSSGLISLASPSSISGALYLDAGATKSIVGIVNGTIYQPYAVNQALADAAAAATLAAGLAPNVVLSSVTVPTQVNATGPQTVVNITGSVNLSGSNCLYFSGAAGSKFIVNVFGGFTLGGGAVVGALPASGLSGSDILINIVGTGAKVTTKIGNVVQGTILGPSRQYELHSVNGAVIGGALELKLMSAATVRYAGFVPLAPPVPIPVGALNISRNIVVTGSTVPVDYQINRGGGN